MTPLAPRIHVIPPGHKVKVTRDYSARPPISDQFRARLAACTTADEVMQSLLALGKTVAGGSSGTHRKWSRMAQRRIEQLRAEAEAARAAAPLIWTPPEPAPRPAEPLIVLA